MRSVLCLLLALLAAFAVLPAKAQISLVATGSVWKYNDTGTDLGTDWRGTNYDDAAWASGPGQLGYGDGDEATVVSFGTDSNNKNPTTYFRLHFNVADASSITNLRARIQRDDGAIAYLNGVEIFRDNMPTGDVFYTNFSATTATDDGTALIPHGFSASGILVSGDNLLAVEIHQANGTSSDISFDLDLAGNPQPSISITSPTNGQTIASSVITINGTAVPGGTNITSIQAFANNVQVGTSTSGSFSIAWSDAAPGEYQVKAILTDSSGLSATSSVITVEVQTPPASLLIPRNSVWKYNNKNVDLGTDWLAINYDDSAANGWASATAPLGDNVESGVQEVTAYGGTVIDIGSPTRFPTIYFRKIINVSQAAGYQGLILRVQRDDAAFIYINGNFVTNVGCAGNNESDPPNLPHTSYCCTGPGAVSGADELTYWEYRVPSSFLIDGPNIFAVEGRQQASTSSDLQFDLEVEGQIDTNPPHIQSVDPTPGAVVIELNHINVLFDENVQGVDASDLLINSEPATNVVFVGQHEYTWYFPSPQTGVVQIAWAPNHGIADTSPLHNQFDGSGTWTYTLNTNIVHSANVIISEFLANNNTGIKDPLDGKRYDWIELYNNSASDPVNMAGWHLTDESTNLTKWTFPAVSIQPKSYYLVWADGESDPTRNLGTTVYCNFKLGSSGGYLALVDPNTNIISEFNPYPAQNPDVSYGRDFIDQTIVGYFTTPTPGAQNATTGPGFVSDPLFSLESGIYTNDSLTLVISNAQGRPIRYTVDGSLPTSSSTSYIGPIPITSNTTIKARCFAAGGTNLFDSRVLAREFIFADATVRDFNSNLPILVIDSRTTIPNDPPVGGRSHGNFMVFEPQGGRTFLRGPTHIELADYELFGQTSPTIWGGFAKKPVRLEIEDEYDNDKDVSLLGMPADSDWKIRANWEKSLMNDFLGFELFEMMGHYSVRRRYVETFVHQGAGRLTASDYGGIQPLLETIKVGHHRVDLKKLTTAMVNEPDISGGYIFKKDKPPTGSSPPDLNFATTTQTLAFHDPGRNDLLGTVAGTNQQNYLKRFLTQMETALSAANFTNAAVLGTNHYSYYMDVDLFVDQFWLNEFTKQIDGYRLSDYFSKDRNGKVGPAPVWDWNLSFGNANYLDCGHYTGWYWNQSVDIPWSKRLLVGSFTGSAGLTGDPDYCQKVADRWGVLRTNVLSSSRLLARIDELVAQLYEGATRPVMGDFTKRFGHVTSSGNNAGAEDFARLGIYQWPEPNGAPNWDVDYQNPLTYNDIIAQVKKWVDGRYNWIDSLFLTAPAFDRAEGLVTSGTTVTLTVPAGATNYYTLDGSDPRATQGGISPSAIRYTGPFTVTSNVWVMARARMANSGSALARPFQNTWSPPALRSYYTALPALRITELMYHPSPPPLGNTNDNDNFEFLEVQNVGSTTLNLGRFAISGGLNFAFPSVTLAPGAYGVIVADLGAFQSRYGMALNVLGAYTNRLGNDGDHVVLTGPAGEKILDFSYQDGWYPVTDGSGFALVINDATNTAPSAYGTASSWRASCALGGSPSAPDTGCPPRPVIVVNELLSFGDPALDALELRNTTASDVNIGGWFLTDDFGTPKKYVIPANTMIPAHGYVVFTENDFNAGGTGFAFGSKGDDVYLFSGDGVNLTGYSHGFDFGAAEYGVTFGRYITSQGEDHFVAQTANTLGTANSGPKIGPVVITEINYHPSDILANRTNGIENNIDEYIEIQNITGTNVPLYDVAYPSNTWHIRDGVDFDFPRNATLPPFGYLLIVGFDPNNANVLAGFRQRMNVSVDVPVFGPWSGVLQNDDEQVELRKPRAPDTNGSVPYILVDRVHYHDSAPWPDGADGLGLTLQRKVHSSYGNDPTNWIAGAASPGAAYSPDTTPAITSQPGDTVAYSTSNVTFNVTGTGSNVRYQWRFMGENITGATNSSLTISNFQVSQGGIFNVLVYNGSGYALGTNFLLRLRLTIVLQPADVNAIQGTTNSFSVAAISSTPLRYQWYFNANAIQPTNNPTATNATLTITNIQLVNQGNYFCQVCDAVECTNSRVATLTVVAKPAIVRQPLSVTVVEGGTAGFSVAAVNSTPMTFRWRTNGFPVVGSIFSIINGITNSTLIVSNCPLVMSNVGITVVITNLAGQSPISASAKLIVLPDSDHDGLPDSWETATNLDGSLQHPGFNPNDPSDGARDDDGDGMSNAAEYIAGTDYLNPNSYLKIEFMTNSVTTLQFTAVSNRTYTIQYKDSLNPTIGWNRLADFLQSTNATRIERFPDSGARTNRFYRITIPVQR